MRFATRGRPKRGESAAKPAAPGAPYGRLGAPGGRPVGFGVRFRIVLAGHDVVEIPWIFPGVGSADGVRFGGSSGVVATIKRDADRQSKKQAK